MNIWQKLLFAWLFVTVWLHPILSKPCAQEPIFYSNLDPNNEVIRICSAAIESMFVGVNIGAALSGDEKGVIDFHLTEFKATQIARPPQYGRLFEIKFGFILNFNGPFTFVDYLDIKCSKRTVPKKNAEFEFTGGAQMAMTLQLEEFKLCNPLDRIRKPCQVCSTAPWSIKNISLPRVPKFKADFAGDGIIAFLKKKVIKFADKYVLSGRVGETSRQLILDLAAKQVRNELNKQSWEVNLDDGDVAIVLNVVDEQNRQHHIPKKTQIMLQIPKIQ